MKNEVSKVLRAAAKVLAYTRKPDSMGTLREGEESYWPLLKKWDADIKNSDAFDAYSEGVYQSSVHPGLFVHFDAWPLQDLRAKPGTYEVRAFGQTKKGKWNHEKEIEKILETAVKWGDQQVKKLAQSIEKIGGNTWEVNYDYGDVNAFYRGKRDEYSDADISVKFESADKVLGGGEAGEAEISYMEGGDYSGAYGKIDVEESYSSIQDMQKILKKAEALFKKKEGL